MAEAAAPADKLTVDNYNWHFVKGDIPRLGLTELTVVARERPTTPLLVHEIAHVVSHCNLIVRCVDTFYAATNPLWDTGRLRLLLSGRSLTLKVFYGHLGVAGIALLPRSVYELGLAIGNATDAEVVSEMRTWRGLYEIRASVTPRVQLEDLRPLPGVMQHGLVFPDITDDRLEIVVPAIIALAPKRRLTVLYFPKSLLTGDGTLLLAQSIRDMEKLVVDFEIIIEPSGNWRPSEEEKELLNDIMKDRVVMQKVTWTMAWIYEAQI